MKKSLTLLLLAIASIGYAQVDIELQSIDKPEYIQDGTGESTTFDLQFTVKNNGRHYFSPLVSNGSKDRSNAGDVNLII